MLTSTSSPSILKERMQALEEQKNEKPVSYVSGVRDISLEEKISKIFINVGIPPHIKGYGFLREGVKMAVEDPEIINNITNCTNRMNRTTKFN